jgi:hypothetical protein
MNLAFDANELDPICRVCRVFIGGESRGEKGSLQTYFCGVLVLDSTWTPEGTEKDLRYSYVFEGFWSGCRDLNSGPLAPQATNINHLQATLNENKRLPERRFGRQMDASAASLCLWTPRGLRSRRRSPGVAGADQLMVTIPDWEMRATKGPRCERKALQIRANAATNTAAISLPRRFPAVRTNTLALLSRRAAISSGRYLNF